MGIFDKLVDKASKKIETDMNDFSINMRQQISEGLKGMEEHPEAAEAAQEHPEVLNFFRSLAGETGHVEYMNKDEDSEE